MRNLLDTVFRRVACNDIDPYTIYLVRTPNGSFRPGRIVETGRLWEMRFADAVPHPSADQAPSRATHRTVGYLALAIYSDNPSAEDIAALRDAPRWVLPAEADAADRAVQAWQGALSGADQPGSRIGRHVYQSLSSQVVPTVADPRRIRQRAGG
jgi:hypothetical protein